MDPKLPKYWPDGVDPGRDEQPIKAWKLAIVGVLFIMGPALLTLAIRFIMQFGS